MNKEQEVEIFTEALNASYMAEHKIAVLSADLTRQIQAIQDSNLARTNEAQATLSLKSIESIVDELKKANDALLQILIKSCERSAPIYV